MKFTSQWRPKLPKKWTVFVASAAQDKSPPFLNIKVGKAYMEYIIIRGKTLFWIDSSLRFYFYQVWCDVRDNPWQHALSIAQLFFDERKLLVLLHRL